MNPPRPAVFLDRDGTLIEERNESARAEQVRLLPGVAVALQMLQRAGFACLVISNQSGVARGYFSERDLEAVDAEMKRQLQEAGASLDKCYYCSELPR